MEDWSEYIAGLVGPLTDYWGRLELEILKSIAERMSAADLYTASSAYEMKKLLEMGMVFDEVLEILAGGMRRTRQQVESIIGQAGLETLRAESERLVGAADGGLIDTALSQRAYDFERTARQSLQRVLASEEPEAVILQQTIRAGAAATEQTFRNLTRTTALGASAQFGRALDAAYMQTTSGAFSATAAVERAVRQLSEHGIDAVIYPSGHVDTVEVAARRAIITGANQTSLLTREEIAVEYDLDLVEVSAHWGARPEHAEWQGGIYSRSGKSSKYQGLVEATGYGTGPGLGGWNCSHTFSSYIEGMPRTYTDEQLEEMKNATVEVDGKKIPYYEAQQKQRAMERTIRGYKRRAATAESDAERYAAIAKEKEWREKYERFCAQTGLKEQPERYQTGRGVDYSGYGKYITGETGSSGGKRGRRAELESGRPELEEGAEAPAAGTDTGRLASGNAGRSSEGVSKPESGGVKNSGEDAAKAAETAETQKTVKTAENKDIHTVGYIDPNIYNCVEPELRTNEVIITEERINHIKERHPGDYENIVNYLRETVEKPDYILEANKPHTAVLLKNVKTENDYIQLILRLAVAEDEEGKKNSIITLLETDKKRYERYLRTKKILYKAPNVSYNTNGTV